MPLPEVSVTSEGNGQDRGVREMRVEVIIEPVNGDVTAYVDGVLADEVVILRTDEDEEED
jgi:hypothetical protein